MTHRFLLALFVAVGLSSGVQVSAQDAPTVLLFVRDGSSDLGLMLTKEVVVMKELLEQAGFNVDVATTAGTLLSAGGITITPDLKLADVSTSRYDGVILPCMAAGPAVASQSLRMIEKAAAEGKPIAAQTGSVRALAAAGLLASRRYAYSTNPTELDPTLGWSARDRRAISSPLRGSTHVGDGVVTDGNIITSGICPMTAKNRGVQQDGTAPLTQEFIKAVARRTR